MLGAKLGSLDTSTVGNRDGDDDDGKLDFPVRDCVKDGILVGILVSDWSIGFRDGIEDELKSGATDSLLLG
jgi:hypothetical protein